MLENKSVGHHISVEIALIFIFAMCFVRCSSQLDCQQSTDPHRWLQSNSSQCIAFIPVSPLKAPIATPTQVSHVDLTALCFLVVDCFASQISVQVLNVPMTGSFECVFGDQGSTVATRSGTSQSLFSCQTPQLNRLPGSGMYITLTFVVDNVTVCFLQERVLMFLYL